MPNIVSVLLDGYLTHHAPPHGYGDYDTLCGLDADDSAIGHGGIIATPTGARIDCVACKSIWHGTVKLGLSGCDFDC